MARAPSHSYPLPLLQTSTTASSSAAQTQSQNQSQAQHSTATAAPTGSNNSAASASAGANVERPSSASSVSKQSRSETPLKKRTEPDSWEEAFTSEDEGPSVSSPLGTYALVLRLPHRLIHPLPCEAMGENGCLALCLLDAYL